MLYLVEPVPDTLGLAGKTCCVNETADGAIEVFHVGRPFPVRVLFDKDPYVSLVAIVANERLGAVLTERFRPPLVLLPIPSDRG